MISTSGRQNVTYFIGTEIENTILKGTRTLFVVGVQSVEEIVDIAAKHDITHIYLGTSQSFTPATLDEWEAWDTMIYGLLQKDFWVTLDYDVSYVTTSLEYEWNEFNTFVPMISVKIPYIRQLNYHATIKIDDSTWGATNTGVWCHSLNELMTRNVYTDWSEYVGDTPITIDD